MAANATQAVTTMWQLDPAHSSVEFSVKHMMMTTVRGRFKEISATLTADEEHPEGCCVEVEIAAASVDTGAPDRDAHLRGPDFFDAERYPTITFRSTRVEGASARDGASFRVVGDLTIRDVTREVVLDATYEGRGRDPWGGERSAFSATTKINRQEFGLRWNQALETGGVLVGKKVQLEIEGEAIRQ